MPIKYYGGDDSKAYGAPCGRSSFDTSYGRSVPTSFGGSAPELGGGFRGPNLAPGGMGEAFAVTGIQTGGGDADMTWKALEILIEDAFNAGDVDTLNKLKENYAKHGNTPPKVPNGLALTSLSDMVPTSIKPKYTGHDQNSPVVDGGGDGWERWDEFLEEAKRNRRNFIEEYHNLTIKKRKNLGIVSGDPSSQTITFGLYGIQRMATSKWSELSYFTGFIPRVLDTRMNPESVFQPRVNGPSAYYSKQGVLGYQKEKSSSGSKGIMKYERVYKFIFATKIENEDGYFLLVATSQRYNNNQQVTSNVRERKQSLFKFEGIDSQTWEEIKRRIREQVISLNAQLPDTNRSAEETAEGLIDYFSNLVDDGSLVIDKF